MGTASSKKFLKHNNGSHQEEAAVLDTAGAADADKIPALNANGVLDPSLLNAVATSAGAGDAAKIPKLDASGRIDTSMMPAGIGADTKILVASEALSAGNYVNVWNDAGTPKVRKADGSASGKRAHGFVLAAVSLGANATVYFEGPNTQVTGMTAGDVFLSAATPGAGTNTAPTGSGQVVQRLGVAVAATEVNFEPDTPFVLA